MNQAQLPAWLSPAERMLRDASTQIRMIAATTPRDLQREIERLHAQWNAGEPCPPQFLYPPRQSHHEIICSLEQLAEALEREGPLASIYADRAREMVSEAWICSTVGTSKFREYARKRFLRRDHFDVDADGLAHGWLEEPFEDLPVPHTEMVRSDDPHDPRSLLLRLRAEIGARKLPFRVVVARDSSALAATGDAFVQIVSGRMLSIADVERTVLHEIEGHVMPRCRANAQRLGIFALGTKLGVDDQEGRALCLERRTGHLTISRRRELAFRHKAARMLQNDADFVETTRTLLSSGARLSDALRITARVFRGGGLGREVVYLPAFLRVDAAMSQNPGLDSVLGAGRVAVDCVETLRSWVQ